jgi:N-methylhydantoinase A
VLALARAVDLRYVGQGYELTVPVPAGPLRAGDIAAVVEHFGREHERTYGHRAASEPVEFVNLRLTARVRAAPHPPARPPEAVAVADAEPRLAYFGREEGAVMTPVLGRGALSERPRPGPAIIEEYDATTVVPPGCLVWRDGWENIVIEVGAAGGGQG